MATSPVSPVVVIASADGHVRRRLSAELREVGYIVIAYADGLAALMHVALGERADVLVAEARMPVGSEGHFLASDVREQRPNLPVVSVTNATPTAFEAVRRAIAGRLDEERA